MTTFEQFNLPKSVQKAIEEAREIDTALVDSAKVRRFMDRLVGFECSRFSRSWRLASMGRVQTPTLGFIIERELLREKHVPIVYNSVNFISNDTNFKIRFHEKDDPEAWLDDSGKHFPDRTFNQDLAAEAITKLNKNMSIEIQSIKEGKNILGLVKDKKNITLEPGLQFELSGDAV